MPLTLPNRTLNLITPQVMGILNVTPDSFSDGGRFQMLNQAIDQAQAMLDAGASLIDIGGESTRPGAQPVSVDEELARVIPVIEALVARVPDVLISIDTSKPEVMRAAIGAGASMINDVCALQLPGALEAAAELNVPVCLMHMQGEPRSMQHNPSYDDVVQDVLNFFENRLCACAQAGIPKERIVLDPGFGFGKTLGHNLELLKQLDTFHALGCPVLAGMSRKSMIGLVLDKPVEERMVGSVSAAVIAAMKGAQIIRVHDVPETVDALRVVHAVTQGIQYAYE